MKLSRILTVFAFAALGIAPLASAETRDAQGVLDECLSAYASLKSYADTGEVVIEQKPIGAATTQEDRSLSTLYKAPKLFRFETVKSDTQERSAVWSDGEQFSTWWSATQVAETYPPGRGVAAFAVTEYPTAGLSTMIPALLFQSANLQSPVLTLTPHSEATEDRLGDRKVWIVQGETAVNHWSQNTRPVRLWIDAETHLIRRIVLDTQTGLGGDAVQRMTVDIAPIENPDIPDADFAFSPPVE